MNRFNLGERPATENHKTLMNKTEGDTSKWKDILCS